MRPKEIMLDEKTRHKLDEDVYTLIGSGKANKAKDILTTIIEKDEVKPVDHRVIDKSLQRLRKDKRIKYNAKTGWSISDDPFGLQPHKTSAEERTVPLPFPELHPDDPENRDG